MGKLKLDVADKLFSLWIRTRDEWTCQRCGVYYEPPTRALHCSHFKGRGKENTRFDPRNADSLCYGCHQYFTSQPDEHFKWQIKRKGEIVVDAISFDSTRYKKKDRKAEAAYWRERLISDFGIKA